MAEINTTENVRLWLRSCPSVSNVDRFNVDFMGENPVEYSLYSSPSTITYKTDILGRNYPDPIQSLNYIFQAVFHYSNDIKQNLENLNFFSDVLAWLYQQNAAKNFPQIREGNVISITPTLSPYVYDADADSGRYQIQIKISYRCKA